MTVQDSALRTGRFTSKHYVGMTYVCEDCGHTETYDGLAVKIRSGFQSIVGGDCAICTMFLQDRDKYWNGEIEPDEVVHHA